MSDRRLTESQRKALLWLSPEAWCGGAGREVSAALGSLCLFHPELVTKSWEVTERGHRHLRYKLTDLGIAERATIA